MARRRSSGRLVRLMMPPQEVATLVVNRYVEQATRNLTVWSGNYTSKIQAYIQNPEATRAVTNKLTSWYTVLVQQLVPRIKELYATAKTEYWRRLYAPPAPTPPPTPPTPPPG